MKFKCLYEDIHKAILSISKVNTKSNIFPIIELIHIEASDNIITFRSTNLEIVLETSINAKVEIKGKVVINYANLSKIINIIKSDSFEIELIDNILEINSITERINNTKNSIDNNISNNNINNNNNKISKSKIKLQTSIYEDIPMLPVINIENSETLIIKRETFISAVRQVIFAVANTDIKPEISSIFIYNKDQYLYTVATDTFRLAENRIDLSQISVSGDINNNLDDNGINMLIPGKNMNIILPILDNMSGETIEISKYEDGIMINNQNTYIAVRTISGNFPDYVQLFPKEYTEIISIDKSELVANLNATVLFKDNYSYSNIKLVNDRIYIKTNNNKIGSYESEIEIQNILTSNIDKDIILNESKEIEYKDKEENNNIKIEADYNSSLLLEGLSKMDSNRVIISFTTANKPIFIKSENNNNFVYVLMSLRR